MFAPMVENAMFALGEHFDAFAGSDHFGEFVSGTEMEFNIEAWRAERGLGAGGSGAASGAASGGGAAASK
jgi:hypothetical protein